MKNCDCPKDYLNEVPPLVGAEHTENFEKLLPLSWMEIAFAMLVNDFVCSKIFISMEKEMIKLQK